MRSRYVVLQHKDIAWVIDTEPNRNNSYTTWSGNRQDKLERINVGYRTWKALVQMKLDEGFHEVENVTLDAGTARIISFSPNMGVDEIPESFWYRVSGVVPVGRIRDYLDITTELLLKLCPEDKLRLENLPVFKALYAGETMWGVEYKEGPLAVFLLFGLRRYLNEFIEEPTSIDLLQVSDDSGDMLPERFYQLEGYLERTCVHMCEANGWISIDDDIIVGDTCPVRSVVEKHNIQHYLSTAANSPIAIAMGCIDAPIDLSVICTNKKAAFF